jgi:hypothetical protein
MTDAVVDIVPVGGVLVTVNEVLAVFELKYASPMVPPPACVAVRVTVPTPVNDRVLPEIVAGPEATVNVTGSPEDA